MIFNTIRPLILGLILVSACDGRETDRKKTADGDLAEDTIIYEEFSEGLALADRIAPSRLTIARGSVSSSPLSVLDTEDLAGSDEIVEKMKEFRPNQIFAGSFFFTLPASLDVGSLSRLEFKSGFKGAATVQQRWEFHLRDFVAGTWVKIGDNSQAKPGIWSPLNMSFNVASMVNHLNAKRELRLRYRSIDAGGGSSGLDYLFLQVATSSGSPQTIEPSPDPLPLPEVAPVAPPQVSTPIPSLNDGIWRPKPGTSWQWQLTGSIDQSIDVQMYDIDLFDTPSATIAALKSKGRKVICYFSAGSYENWRPDAAKFPASIKGKSNGWAGENWLDIRNLTELGPIMRARLDLAVQKGCDGVEPDNIDGYTNSTGFSLTANDQLVYNKWLASEAHTRNLSIGLKNDLDQVKELVAHFDWALNEQCFQYNECEMLIPFVQAGKAVFGVEYQGTVSTFCTKANGLNFDWLKKNLDLDASRTACR